MQVIVKISCVEHSDELGALLVTLSLNTISPSCSILDLYLKHHIIGGSEAPRIQTH